MAKLIEIGVKIPASVPEGSPLELVYPTAYVAAARAAGGMFEGRAGPLESDGWRSALAKTGSSVMQAYGGEVGDPLPPLVQLRVKPRGAGVKGLDWHIEGHPRDTGGGAWDGSRYGTLPGDVMATAGQVQSLSTLLATGQQQQAQVEQALADLAQSTEELRSVAGTYTLGREPHAGDPAGTYRVATAAGAVDVSWNGAAETGRTPALATPVLAEQISVQAIALATPVLAEQISVQAMKAMKARQGLNAADYAYLCPGYSVGNSVGNITDWLPGLTQMIADATPNSVITMPAGNYPISNEWRIDKPLNWRAEGAFLIADGDAFKNTGDIFALPFNSTAVLNIVTSIGNGSFGDNPGWGAEHHWAVLQGVLPGIKRANTAVNYLDGSVGIRINNAYYPRLEFQAIENCHITILITADKTGSEKRGSSHGEYALGRLGGIRNVVLNCNGTGGSTDGGWITTNSFYKGGFGSPHGGIWASYADVPLDHTHITIIGADYGWCYANIFHDPYLENWAICGLEVRGPTEHNGIILDSEGGYEMPVADSRGLPLVRIVDTGGKPRYTLLRGGITANQVLDTGVDTIIENAGYSGYSRSFGGIAEVWPALGSQSEPIGEGRQGREWFLPNAELQTYYTLTYAGAPLEIDAAKYRRILINVPAAGLPSGAVTISNAPTKLNGVVQITLQQPEGGSAIAADWIAGLKYGAYPLPVRRSYGTDTYSILLPVDDPVSNVPQVVGHRSRNPYRPWIGNSNWTAADNARAINEVLDLLRKRGAIA